MNAIISDKCLTNEQDEVWSIGIYQLFIAVTARK